MKNIKLIILNILLILLLLFTTNCYAFDFEFNSNTYSINYDIPRFPISYDSINFSSYLLVYNCELNNFDLLCFDNDNIYIERLEERIRFLDSNNVSIYRAYIYNLSNNSWVYSASKTRYDFPSTLGNQVFIYKSNGVTINSNVYDISSDGSVTLDFILKDTEITVEGYKYIKTEEQKPTDTIYDITNKIYTIICVLNFTIIIIFLYKYLKSSFAFRR